MSIIPELRDVSQEKADDKLKYRILYPLLTVAFLAVGIGGWQFVEGKDTVLSRLYKPAALVSSIQYDGTPEEKWQSILQKNRNKRDSNELSDTIEGQNN
jgi:hypothetical protein